ncbi:hypothetical protein B0T25DRAFT_568122 [Lasiosphaeria hispida]|uniref:Transmembrane protein n=1 Tax=Lasiosphaeria hispida TaxID=260671 RepID=A0AAJ0HHN7_9PEZI|nr:hypothetical protein B0T25DRAFT_568122 [Lasiosphaeria hispida]
MAILAASTSKPTRPVALHHRSDVNVISNLGPFLNRALQFQQLLSSATLLLFIRTVFAARLLATILLLASRVAAFRTLLAVNITKRLSWSLWDSKPSRRFRKKLEFEFFVLVLGPGGNALLLLLFWPGWIILGLLVLCVLWAGAG